jgi:hypothetical protein
MKLQQVIESQEKAKSKVTWRRARTTARHIRDKNYAQVKSANHQTKARKPQRAPPAHMQAPPEPMQLPLDECMQSTSHTVQLLQHYSDRSDRWTRSSSTWELHRSDRCTSPVRRMTPGKLPELENSSKLLGNLVNAWSKRNHARTSPPCWQCMNQAKNST